MTIPNRALAPPERWNHGEDSAVVGGRQQILGPVELLRRMGRVGDAEVTAGARYYADYAFGVHGVRDDGAGGRGGGVDGYNIAAIEALGAFLDVGRRLGHRTSDVLYAHVILECSLRAIHSGSRAREAAAKQLAKALKALVEHYATVDGTPTGAQARIRVIHVAGEASQTP